MRGMMPAQLRIEKQQIVPAGSIVAGQSFDIPETTNGLGNVPVSDQRLDAPELRVESL